MPRPKHKYILSIQYADHHSEHPVQIEVNGTLVVGKTLKSALVKAVAEIESQETR